MKRKESENVVRAARTLAPTNSECKADQEKIYAFISEIINAEPSTRLFRR